MRFIIQDREAASKDGREVWNKELPAYVKEERVQFMVHDFYTEQPVKDAEVYNLRYILYVLRAYRHRDYIADQRFNADMTGTTTAA